MLAMFKVITFERQHQEVEMIPKMPETEIITIKLFTKQDLQPQGCYKIKVYMIMAKLFIHPLLFIKIVEIMMPNQ